MEKMDPTHTAGSIHEGTSAPQERWSGLHDDLLGMVLARLDSLPDRIRFAAVCTPWRAAVSTRPPRHLHPCLVLDPHDRGTTKRAYYPGDGVILPLATRLNETGGNRFVRCHTGGWVACEAPLSITNVFSGAEVALPADPRSTFATLKVIFPESPTSRTCIIAAITDKYEVVIRGLASPERGWTTRRIYGQPVMDIAFCNGHLYCLTGQNKEMAKFEVRLDEYGVLVVGAGHWLAIQNQLIMQNRCFTSEGDPDAHVICIFELRGKLAMAVRRTWVPWHYSSGPFFVVFELVDVDTNIAAMQHLCTWVEVTSLGDHALFLGPTCSKAVQVSTGGRGGPRRNHIYYSHHRCYKEKARLPDNAKEFFTSFSSDRRCRVYYKEDESEDDSMEGITSVGYYVCGGGHPTMWLFPPGI